MHTAGDKVPMVSYPWQANAAEMPTKQPVDTTVNQRERSAKKDTQAVLSNVASLKAELYKLTGDMVTHKKNIDDG